MNERIKELAERCWDTRLDGRHFDIEQFAELIVRECASVCDSYGMPDGTSQTAMILSRAIKNKFGIE